jgi:hypothetical protein
MIKLSRLILEAKKVGDKIKRDAFIYLDPKGETVNFAQCSTCRLWTGTGCLLLGKTKVTGDMSCSFYVSGEPQRNLSGKEEALLTPKEAGLVTRKVRCENCRSFDGGQCMLFNTLNKKLPDIFDLEESVSSNACCNAQMPPPND